MVRKLGGIGIDRSQHNHLIEFITQRFKEEDFSLVVTPEGTRSRVNKWRMGFYHIALSAQVPVVLGAGDFKKKTIYIGKTISLTDLQTRSQESIMQEIYDFYKDINPKYPEQWNPLSPISWHLTPETWNLTMDFERIKEKLAILADAAKYDVSSVDRKSVV